MLTAAILYVLAAYATPEQMCTRGGYRCEALVRCAEHMDEPTPVGYELAHEACDYIREYHGTED